MDRTMSTIESTEPRAPVARPRLSRWRIALIAGAVVVVGLAAARVFLAPPKEVPVAAPARMLADPNVRRITNRDAFRVVAYAT